MAMPTETTPGTLPETHLLALPRPNAATGPTGAIDTTTLAAHDFDVDNRTGFMPPHPPLSRLPPKWSIWEDILTSAQERRLQLGDSAEGRSAGERANSAGWRESVKTMGILSTKELCQSELYLRRAHHVLAWILHFYVHTIAIEEDEQEDNKIVITIPRALSLPLLRVCAQLQLPPVLTYSDDVLYNWEFDPACTGPEPKITPNTPLRCQTLFTHTTTESVFYLVSAHIELIGVHALSLMRATMDELFVADDIAARRITGYLTALQSVLKRMKDELLGMKAKGCDPDTFFHRVRPWLRGCAEGSTWIFEGLDEAREAGEEDIWEPVELAGPSAGQSSLIHALDIFLGVDKRSHSVVPLVQPQQSSTSAPDQDAHKSSFLTRMQQYMPRHHRHFLSHLAACSSTKTSLREFVVSRAPTQDVDLVNAYNGAVVCLKEFRDAHLIVVALFIVGPAAKARAEGGKREALRGTGGTDLVQFLKTVRDQTKSAVLK